LSGLSSTAGAHIDGLRPDSRKEKLGPGSAMMAALMRTSCASASTRASPLRSSSHARKFNPLQSGRPFRMICVCYRTTNTGTLPSARTSDV
jgi:hypothetical protein